MKKKQLVLIGGGGHCKSCIDVINASGDFEIIAILDVEEKIGEMVNGYTITASDRKLEDWVKEEHLFLITIGQIKHAELRKKIYGRLVSLQAKMATVIAPSAIVSPSAIIGEGTIIMHQATVNADAIIGRNCIINTNANIEHDSRIGNHVHISTGSIVNGGCKVGNETFIGSNSVLVNGIAIGANIVTGAGTVVIKDLTEQGTYAGNPCRKIN